MTPGPRVTFRWDYLISWLRACAFFGAVTLAINLHKAEKAYREIGLAGFAEISLWLVGVGLLGVAANYLWCLWLQERGRESRSQGRRVASGDPSEG